MVQENLQCKKQKKKRKEKVSQGQSDCVPLLVGSTVNRPLHCKNLKKIIEYRKGSEALKIIEPATALEEFEKIKIWKQSQERTTMFIQILCLNVINYI